MNKTALKNFATSARNELIKKVEARALKIGITEESIKKAQFESSDAIYIDGKQLSLAEKKQRDKLIQRIREIGFKNVVEEVAYTWFNRFIALRFMEVNNYLPTKVRVLSSSEPGNPEPDIIKEALSVDLDIDKELVYDLKLNNKTEELFKYMIIKQCNDLNKYLPFMFETIEDYKEILFPEGLLAKESFLREMADVTEIPESDWEQVEIIGWLYQYYIAEKKDQVFADLKNNIKISKENIPAATQLFTPHWIVRYMVENSLGRLWLESYPESPLKSEWKYFLDEAEQEQQVKDELAKIRHKDINPESITFLDPCCGSGHILVYAFDVFYAMYLEKGYIPHEIPKLILEKNLFGLDIDDRAAQLASFAVMMKAREKSRRVFGQGIEPNICAIQESNWMTEEIIDVLVDNSAPQLVKNAQRETLHHLRDTFKDAKTYGSILKFEQLDLDFLQERLEHFANDSEYEGDLIERISTSKAIEKIPGLIMQARILCRKYGVVCTNPPYMGSGGMPTKLSDFVKKEYPGSKSDLFAVFIERCTDMLSQNAFQAMITQQVWMLLESYQKLRDKLLLSDMVNMAHLGPRAFDEIGGEVVQTTAFVLRKSKISRYNTTFIRLVDYDQPKLKESKFLQGTDRYVAQASVFRKIPESPIAYWLDHRAMALFDGDKVADYLITREGMTTADNDKFLREWYEVEHINIGFDIQNNDEAILSNRRWFPYQKGGAFRKWYGNLTKVVNWENDGYQIRNHRDAKTGRVRSHNYNDNFGFLPGVTFPGINSGKFGTRYSPPGFMFDTTGAMGFAKNKGKLLEILALMNTSVFQYFLDALVPNLRFKLNKIMSVPAIFPTDAAVLSLSKECIEMTKEDWDSTEISWDFRMHPLLKNRGSYPDRIQSAFERCFSISKKKHSDLKNNEEELNRLFATAYGLEGIVQTEVADEDVSILMADRERDIKSFVSYAVGCMFGRYSLDQEGLVFAGGNFDSNKYNTFKSDEDNILPILSDVYFEDDIVSRFVEFVKVTFGEEPLTQNLEFIADTLGKKDSETPREAVRRYFLNDYFKDHLQVYKKKPIYWLFTSGKQKAFNCLIYMHRYDKTTLSRIRTDYVHELQIRFDAEKKSLLSAVEGDGTAREISAAKKELKTLELKIAELKEYEEVLHHMADQQIEIDLDDGVDVNYEKFASLLAKRK